MFNIKHIEKEEKNQNYISIQNLKGNICAKICLDKGASLNELTLNNHHIIKNMYPLSYNSTYASSILFPFVNRIKDGSYEFEGKTYQFDINEKELNNALHGLVYNKRFEILNQETTETDASILLVYHETNKNHGFPYTYSIFLKYVLTEKTLALHVDIRNTDSKAFPFSLGWHPYFISDDLYNSSLTFNSKRKIKLDDRNITEGIMENKHVNGFKVKSQFLDDCYILDSNTILFITPKYSLTLKSSEKNTFLQVYTPPYKNAIAIEPTTGVSDSFNNGIGLKRLDPNENYSINWNLRIDNN